MISAVVSTIRVNCSDSKDRNKVDSFIGGETSNLRETVILPVLRFRYVCMSTIIAKTKQTKKRGKTAGENFRREISRENASLNARNYVIIFAS